MDDFILNQLLNFCFDDEETASPDYYKEQICRWLYENGLIESDNGIWVRPKGEEDDQKKKAQRASKKQQNIPKDSLASA